MAGSSIALDLLGFTSHALKPCNKVKAPTPASPAAGIGTSELRRLWLAEPGALGRLARRNKEVG